MARRTAAFYVYAGSIGLHAAIAAAAVLVPKPKHVETVAITMAEAKKKPKAEEPVKPPPPPPPPKPAAKAKAAPAPAPKAAPAEAPPPAEAPAPAAADPGGFADLGFAMGNGGGNGIALPSGPRGPAPQAAAKAVTRKVSALAPKSDAACDETPVKAKLRGSIVKPVYTEQARAAQIEGAVRIEVTIDETGRVVQARVLQGLGYGLDEAALVAAKQMTFEPGTKCGKPSVTTLSMKMRFDLGS